MKITKCSECGHRNTREIFEELYNHGNNSRGDAERLASEFTPDELMDAVARSYREHGNGDRVELGAQIVHRMLAQERERCLDAVGVAREEIKERYRTGNLGTGIFGILGDLYVEISGGKTD